MYPKREGKQTCRLLIDGSTILTWCANPEHHDVNAVVSIGEVGEQNGRLPKVACLNTEGDVLEADAVAQPLC